MDFNSISQKLTTSIIEILNSGTIIQHEQVLTISHLLKRFADLKLNNEQIKVVRRISGNYFALLEQYAIQYKEISDHQAIVIRSALDVFLFVVEAKQMCESITSKFYKLIDACIQNENSLVFKREFLRVYSYLLDKISKKSILNLKLASKHTSLHVLHNIIKHTCDIETQAIILEIVIKFLKCTESSVLDEHFLDVLQIVDISSVNRFTIYQDIRMILDQLNEQSDKIFSINCCTIELDSVRILEFEEANNTQDLWLDFNLTEKKISFFCVKRITEFFSDIFFKAPSTWEVLSFYAKDLLKPTFFYNPQTNNLTISCEIKISSIILFKNNKLDKKMNFKVVISKYSNRFNKLVSDVLPVIFQDTFSLTSLNISLEQDNNSSQTPDLDINDLESHESSSPVIDHFEMRSKKMKISTRNERCPPPMNMSNCELSYESIIEISDDNAECVGSKQTLGTSHQNKCNYAQRKLKVSGSPFVRNYDNSYQYERSGKIASFVNSRLNFSKNGEFASKINDHVSELNNNVIEKDDNAVFEDTSNTVKVSTLKPDTVNMFNKSVSPISFSEFALGKLSPSPSASFQKNIKISSLNQQLNGMKISRCNDISKSKISSSLMSPIINFRKKQKNVRNNTKSTKKKSKEILTILAEDVLDKSKNTSLNSSLMKVHDWLQKVYSTDNNISHYENHLCIDDDIVNVFSEVPQFLHPVCTQISERSSDMPPEKRLEILMCDDKELEQEPNSVNNVSQTNCNTNTVEELLHILNSSREEEVEIQTSHDLTEISFSPEKNKISECLEDSDVLSIKSNDSNLPLSVLKVKWDCEKKKNVDEENDGNSESSEADAKNLSRETLDVNQDKMSIEKDVEKFMDGSVIEEIEDNMNNISPLKFEKNSITKDDINTFSHSDQQDNSIKSPTNKSNFNISVQSTSSSKSAKRKLYIPGDFSYLNASITEEYLKFKNNDFKEFSNSKVMSIKSKTKKIKVEPTKIKSKTYRKNLNTTRKTNSHLELSKSDIIGVKVESAKKNKTDNSAIFTKVFNSLKEKYREHKKQVKIKKRKGSKKLFSSSSSSSMEPFGVALGNSRRKRKSAILPNLSKTIEKGVTNATATEFSTSNPKEKRKTKKRAKKNISGCASHEKDVNVSHHRENAETIYVDDVNGNEMLSDDVKESHDLEKTDDSLDKNKKINIISNIVIQPASVQNQKHPTDRNECCSCSHWINISSKFYLELVQHMQRCHPELLKNETCGAIFNILQKCLDTN